jgi:hypothetical protein
MRMKEEYFLKRGIENILDGDGDDKNINDVVVLQRQHSGRRDNQLTIQ